MWYKLRTSDSNLWMSDAVLSLTTCTQVGKRLLMQAAERAGKPKRFTHII